MAQIPSEASSSRHLLLKVDAGIEISSLDSIVPPVRRPGVTSSAWKLARRLPPPAVTTTSGRPSEISQRHHQDQGIKRIFDEP